ncbi:MAG: hypothetical protein JOY71_18040 [Acetobacteraceae bacterium]|nr:hypothetical protein [Acetobacteraceae bacterium]MBV8523995.1 hypothetical protein [Acetobacteraceae bacterium]
MAANESLRDYNSRAQRRFVVVLLAACLVLQRFGFPSSGTEISIAVPITAAMSCWYLGKGVLAIDRTRLAIMLALVAIALLSFNLQINAPLAIVTRTSVPSLLFWLGITSVAVLRFTTPMDERVFFGLVSRCLSWIAVCGIAEFLAQFVGVKLFSFQSFLPEKYSFEPMYNVVTPATAGSSILRSNGFFLVEPSVFSQFIAIGLACEWMNERRPVTLSVFLFALFCSVSGTGWLAVGAFVLGLTVSSSGRGLAMGIMFSCICALAFFVIGLVLPEATETLQSRIGEFWMPGSSGYLRFATPIMALSHIFDQEPFAMLTGMGPGSATTLATITYEYGTGTPGKILLEYGLFGLIAYVALILANRRTRAQTAVLMPVLVVLMLGGGYDHFPPVLFPVLLIATIANLSSARRPEKVITSRLSGNPETVVTGPGAADLRSKTAMA